MQIEYLIEFSVLAEIKNFTAAASQLYTTEASLSRHIKKLEEELGAPLLKRSTRHVEVTEFGRSILPYAQRFSALSDEMNSTIKWLTKPSLNIAIYGVLQDYIQIGNIISEFTKANPGITVNIRTAQTPVKDLLDREACDIVFSPEVSWMEDISYDRTCVSRDNLTLLLPRSHPLAKAKKISLQDVQGERFITLSKSSPMHTICLQACGQAGFTPNIVMTMAEGDDVVHMVGKGMGIGLLLEHPSRKIHPEFPYFENIYFASPSPPVEVAVNMIYSFHPSPAAKRFIEFFKKHLPGV